MKFGVNSMGFDWNQDHGIKRDHQELQNKRRRSHSSDLVGIAKLYSWLVIIVTVVSYFCIIVTIAEAETRTRATKAGTSNSHLSQSTSTIRPWPSHEFFQAIINEDHRSTPQNNSSSNSTEFTKDYQNNHQSSSEQHVDITEEYSTPNGSNSSETITNTKPPKEYNHNPTKEAPAKLEFQDIENADSKNISLNNVNLLITNQNNSVNAGQNHAWKYSDPSPDLQFMLVNSDRRLLGSDDVGDDKSSQVLRNTPNAESKTIESRHWVSLTPSTSALDASAEEVNLSSRRSSTISTNDELPFRVIRRKKTQTTTELSPEFYAKLTGVENSSPNSWHTGYNGKLPFVTSKIPEWSLSSVIQNYKLQDKPQHDYVDDEISHGWWPEEENQSFVPSPTKPPDFSRITWPYTKLYSTSTHLKSTTKRLQTPTQFPILTSSSTFTYPKITKATTTTTTSYPTGIFPILVQTTPRPISNHWGSSGSFQKLAVPFRINSGVAHSSSFTVTQSPLSYPQVAIKISSDITATSTDASNSEFHLNTASKHSIEFHNSNEKNTQNSTSSVNGSFVNGFNMPTNLWYKPTINHHYNSSPGTADHSGMGMENEPSDGMPAPTPFPVTSMGTSSTHVSNSYFNSTQVPILIPPENEYSATGAGNIMTKDTDEKLKPVVEQYFPQILFKLWKYSNGSLELADQKIIPNWILRDYALKEDRVLNLDELPRAIQRIVEEKIELKDVESGYSDDSNLPNERQGFDSHWEQLPIIQPGADGSIQIVNRRPPQYSKLTKKPITLNYVLWNPNSSSSSTKIPPAFGLESHEHDYEHETTTVGNSAHVQQYLQQLQLKNKPQPQAQVTAIDSGNWNAIKNYLKHQAGTRLPPYLPVESPDSPPLSTLFPDFDDKHMSNLAAVSLILAYLNRNKENNQNGPYFGLTTQPPVENFGSLFTSLQKDPKWDAMQPVLQHMLYNQNNKNNGLPSPSLPLPHHHPRPRPQTPAFFIKSRPTSTHYDYFDSSWEEMEHSTASPLNRFSLSLSDLNFLPNGFLKTTVATTSTTPATSTTTTTTVRPPRRPRPTVKRLRVNQTPRPTTLVTKGETSDYELDNPDDNDLTKTLLTSIAKKKIKKKIKKLKKKKGWYDFDINFDIGIDVADVLRKKILALLALKYAPFLVLALATIAPTLILCFPYILKAWRHKLTGYGHHNHHTYVYPYTYAYPVSQSSYEDPNFDNGWGWGANGKNSKSNTEIHHHFHDLPPSLSSTIQKHALKSNPYGEVSAGDYNDYISSYETKPVSDYSHLQQSYAPTTQIHPFKPSLPFVSVTVPAVPVTPAPEQASPHFSFPQQESISMTEHFQPIQSMIQSVTLPQSPPLFPLKNYQADEYMKRIRAIGRNLGKIIGSQISDVGNHDAMQVILGNKKDTINQMLQKLNIFKATDFMPQLKDSDEDDHENVYRRKSAPFRKRRRRSLYFF